MWRRKRIEITRQARSNTTRPPRPRRRACARAHVLALVLTFAPVVVVFVVDGYGCRRSGERAGSRERECALFFWALLLAGEEVQSAAVTMMRSWAALLGWRRRHLGEEE